MHHEIKKTPFSRGLPGDDVPAKTGWTFDFPVIKRRLLNKKRDRLLLSSLLCALFAKLVFWWNRQHISRKGQVSEDWRWVASNMWLVHCPAAKQNSLVWKPHLPEPPTQACRSTAAGRSPVASWGLATFGHRQRRTCNNVVLHNQSILTMLSMAKPPIPTTYSGSQYSSAYRGVCLQSSFIQRGFEN